VYEVKCTKWGPRQRRNLAQGEGGTNEWRCGNEAAKVLKCRLQGAGRMQVTGVVPHRAPYRPDTTSISPADHRAHPKRPFLHDRPPKSQPAEGCLPRPNDKKGSTKRPNMCGATNAQLTSSRLLCFLRVSAAGELKFMLGLCDRWVCGPEDGTGIRDMRRCRQRTGGRR
jgi:hypothetical protein